MALNTDEETWRKFAKASNLKTCYKILNRGRISTLQKKKCDLNTPGCIPPG